MTIRAWLVRLAVLLCMPSLAAAVTLTLPSRSVGPGQILTIPIALSGQGAAIAGLQFDLEWDIGLQVQIATGKDLVGADKILYSQPLADRRLRILIVGFN